MSLAANSDPCVIEVGGIPIGLRTDHRSFLENVCQRYAGFLSSSAPEIELEVDVADLRPVSDDDVRVRREGSAWLLERGDFQARWDFRGRRGLVRQGPNPYALDSVLRILHSLLLAERGGFLLHAASAICAGSGNEARQDGRAHPSLYDHGSSSQAYLFSGVSGAGKTTIARLAPAGVTLLTDEISYVRPGPEGGYCAFGTPFSGELAKPGENCSAPVAALFFLEKGRENRIRELPTTEAVSRLMRNILFFAEDRDLVENLLATACDFVQKVPMRRLTFYPDSRVWDEIRNFDRMPEHV